MQLTSKVSERPGAGGPAGPAAISGWLLKRSPALGADRWTKQWCVLHEDEHQDSWVLDCFVDESGRRGLDLWGLSSWVYEAAMIMKRDSPAATPLTLDQKRWDPRRRKLCHIVLGFAARVLPINSKHVPAVLAAKLQQRPCSFVLDSGEGRLCPFYVFDAVGKESLNSWSRSLDEAVVCAA
eukprot:Skav233213  [mRNA]  locus=scaffold3062:19447:19989:- [translate_table: standard]